MGKQLKKETLQYYIGQQIQVQQFSQDSILQGQVKKINYDESQEMLEVIFEWLMIGNLITYAITGWQMNDTNTICFNTRHHFTHDLSHERLALEIPTSDNLLIFLPREAAEFHISAETTKSVEAA